MTVHWLRDLADILRSAGLPVTEVAGWKDRCFTNPTGTTTWPGYETGNPTHFMVHHTASHKSTDGVADVKYILTGASWGTPICNLYLDRSGRWWVIAAGRTATNGSGEDTWGGGVPKDMMNMYALSVEAANDGVGEPWPAAQTNSLIAGTAALCYAYGISIEHVRAHHEWSPGRKIDPAGNSPWAIGANKWNMGAFRADLKAKLAEKPQQKPSVTKPRIIAPASILKQGVKNNPLEVKKFQSMCNFFSWHDASGKQLTVDGDYGKFTTEACKSMQKALKLKPIDGIYGRASEVALQDFLDAMSKLAK